MRRGREGSRKSSEILTARREREFFTTEIKIVSVKVRLSDRFAPDPHIFLRLKGIEGPLYIYTRYMHVLISC